MHPKMSGLCVDFLRRSCAVGNQERSLLELDAEAVRKVGS